MIANNQASVREKTLVWIILLISIGYSLYQIKPNFSLEHWSELKEIIDAYTTKLDSHELQQGVIGITLELGEDDIHPRIHKVLPGSVAQEVGFSSKTYITELDGRSTAAMSRSEWYKTLRGKVGTTVTIIFSDQDYNAPERIIELKRQPISSLTSRLAQYLMIVNNGRSTNAYEEKIPAFINEHHGMQILEFFDDNTGPANISPTFKDPQKCHPQNENKVTEPKLRRFYLQERTARAVAKRLGIKSAPAYFFAPHGSTQKDPRQYERDPLHNYNYRAVCNHGTQARPGAWSRPLINLDHKANP